MSLEKRLLTESGLVDMLAVVGAALADLLGPEEAGAGLQAHARGAAERRHLRRRRRDAHVRVVRAGLQPADNEYFGARPRTELQLVWLRGMLRRQSTVSK